MTWERRHPCELLPTDSPKDDPPAWTFCYGTPPGLKKYPNVQDWHPGDLILLRDHATDVISTSIREVQANEYGADHASWTHAAMYIGDGWRVCEATVDGIFSGGDVRITPLWSFCDSTQAIRVRRPQICIDHPEIGWHLVIEAMRQITSKYDALGIATLALKRLALPMAAFTAQPKRMKAPLVCSTLYAEAYCSVTRSLLGGLDDMCMPALLSKSLFFRDVPLYWRNV
jgi:hypothetical protein